MITCPTFAVGFSRLIFVLPAPSKISTRLHAGPKSMSSILQLFGVADRALAESPATHQLRVENIKSSRFPRRSAFCAILLIVELCLEGNPMETRSYDDGPRGPGMAIRSGCGVQSAITLHVRSVDTASTR